MEIKKTCESQENIQQESGLQTVTVKLVSIYEYTRKGATIVTVKTDKGIFSNFKNVFQQQMLDVDALKEGDELEITYVIADIGEGRFRNYKKLKSLSHTSNSECKFSDRLSALEKDIAELKRQIAYLNEGIGIAHDAIFGYPDTDQKELKLDDLFGNRSQDKIRLDVDSI